jgi:hypothetical protein
MEVVYLLFATKTNRSRNKKRAAQGFPLIWKRDMQYLEVFCERL